MKKIEAVIPRSQLNAVRVALEQRGIRGGLTLTEVQWSDSREPSAVSDDSQGLQNRVKLELMVGDRQTPKAIDIILRHACPGSDPEHGHIVVLDVDETLQIRPPNFEA
jgi:nitrogen regulatory protein PII